MIDITKHLIGSLTPIESNDHEVQVDVIINDLTLSGSFVIESNVSLVKDDSTGYKGADVSSRRIDPSCLNLVDEDSNSIGFYLSEEEILNHI